MFTTENCMMIMFAVLVLILCVKNGIIGGHPHPWIKMSDYFKPPRHQGPRRGRRRRRMQKPRMISPEVLKNFKPPVFEPGNFGGNLHGGHKVRKCTESKDCKGYMGLDSCPNATGSCSYIDTPMTFCGRKGVDFGLKNAQKQPPGDQQYCRVHDGKVERKIDNGFS